MSHKTAFREFIMKLNDVQEKQRRCLIFPHRSASQIINEENVLDIEKIGHLIFRAFAKSLFKLSN